MAPAHEVPARRREQPRRRGSGDTRWRCRRSLSATLSRCAGVESRAGSRHPARCRCRLRRAFVTSSAALGSAPSRRSGDRLQHPSIANLPTVSEASTARAVERDRRASHPVQPRDAGRAGARTRRRRSRSSNARRMTRRHLPKRPARWPLPLSSPLVRPALMTGEPRLPAAAGTRCGELARESSPTRWSSRRASRTGSRPAVG